MPAILELPEVRQRVSPLSVEEYHRLGEYTGRGKRTELIRGLVIEIAVSSPALDRENASLSGPNRDVAAAFMQRPAVYQNQKEFQRSRPATHLPHCGGLAFYGSGIQTRSLGSRPACPSWNVRRSWPLRSP